MGQVGRMRSAEAGQAGWVMGWGDGSGRGGMDERVGWAGGGGGGSRVEGWQAAGSGSEKLRRLSLVFGCGKETAWIDGLVDELLGSSDGTFDHNNMDTAT